MPARLMRCSASSQPFPVAAATAVYGAIILLKEGCGLCSLSACRIQNTSAVRARAADTVITQMSAWSAGDYLDHLADGEKGGHPHGSYSLAATLQALEHFLRTPLHPCDSCDSRCDPTHWRAVLVLQFVLHAFAVHHIGSYSQCALCIQCCSHSTTLSACVRVPPRACMRLPTVRSLQLQACCAIESRALAGH